MRLLWHMTAAGLLAAALVLSTGAVSANDDTVYRWIGEDGSLHFIQGRENIPPLHRAKAVPLGSIGREQSPGPRASPAEQPAERAAVPPLPAVSAKQPQPPPPDAPERIALDELMEKAQTADQYLVIGEAYLRLGLPLAAKSCADKAATVAATSDEWGRVAGAYTAVGEPVASNEARSKSERLLQVERALQNLTR